MEVNISLEPASLAGNASISGEDATGYTARFDGSTSGFGAETGFAPDMMEVERSLQRLNAILRKIASCNYTFIIANG